jgi:hypothetical protein
MSKQGAARLRATRAPSSRQGGAPLRVAQPPSLCQGGERLRATRPTSSELTPSSQHRPVKSHSQGGMEEEVTERYFWIFAL